MNVLSSRFYVLSCISYLIYVIAFVGCEESKDTITSKPCETSDPGCLSPDLSQTEEPAADQSLSPEMMDAAVTMNDAEASSLDASLDDPAVPYELVFLDQEPIYSYGDVNFQNALSSIDLGSGPFEDVQLTITLHTSCFPFEGWSADPPPEGHNWPPSCDAFDRNFEVSLTPSNGASEPGAEGPAELELMRAITPFGGPSTHQIDLTDYANMYPGESQLRVHITTWSDGAGQVSGSRGMWSVSVKAQVTPGMPPRSVIGIIPLFNRTYRADHAPLEVPFIVPEGVRRTRLEYRTTGHGGGNDPSSACIGHAEEFCQRDHILGIDGRDLETITPWRDDCELGCTLTRQETSTGGFDYCAENPTGDQRSVRAPRANWCPGSITPPFIYDVPNFTVPGEHSFYLEIQDLHPEGMWRISALVYLYGE